ncbi:hypothetical protein SETIT_1G234400v2 [Setaria italica]|uniref:Protein kinase domain-containing protein n=1 Tax=Setaria italica TaxID=4555 RepID=A0A368PPF3_SETIT|nr:hypothetical protein SETIT_1G234400v2 [Setaria italica]
MCCAKQPVKSSMLLLLVWLLLSYFFGNIHCSTVPKNSTDMLSLLDFKQAITNDPGKVLSNWTASTPYCQWTGVKCSRTHTDRVVVLDLAGHSLTGTLTASLGNLTFLRILNLSVNHFSGHLPHLNHLHQLEVLNLSSNSLQGVIPDTLTNCSNLRKLFLAYNFLEGEIPLNVGLLSKLSTLQLTNNSLTGAIPPSLNNTLLEKIGLANNRLTGSIPSELGYLSNLSVLLLGGNMLSGVFPAFLLNMSTLIGLHLGRNLLHGELPSNIGSVFPSLRNLVLSINKFEGQIPASIGNVPNLEVIDLSSNNFTGQVPSSFGNLLQLNKLILEDNMLEAPDTKSWEFLYALRNCNHLNVLSLAGNRLTGAIPDYIGKLPTGLAKLYLDDNHLSGLVPSSIGNLTGLIWLDLDNNKLTGTIGEWIGMLKKLQYLDLSENSLNGPIPSSIGNLTRLGVLDLGQNEFTGTIPTSLAYLQQLIDLDFSYNKLEGNLPSVVFSIPTLTTFVLSYNKLEGPMPSEVGHLTQLTLLLLSSNKIFGEIPDTLSQCQELNILELDKNCLTGSIPVSLGNLKSLSVLNLSHNNFSGLIPSAIGDIKTLTCLDLSYNRLQGEIPFGGIFANATAVSLNGNSGLCGGSLDLRMAPCASVSSQRFERQYFLIKILIPIFGFMSLILLIYFVLVEKKMSRPYSLLPYFGDKFPKFSYMDLAEATGNFSNLVGRGSYGSVYRGKLIPSKLEVAVKVLDLDIHGAEKSFISECEALRGIKHRNLLPIITACSTVDITGSSFKALVYPFMPNGNLDTWLHHKEGNASKYLSLNQRLSIAVNIADALEYLHNDNGRTIIHCDLKPSNILLDDDMTAHLGDFGISSFHIDSVSTSVEDLNMASSKCIASIGVKGTIGYIAPGI